jgi:hypothetical protein
MRVKVEVTQEDIDQGIPSDCTDCPVALALCRVLDLPDTITVAHSIIRLPTPDGWQRIRIPDHVRQWIYTFDRKGRSRVGPMTFELEVPEKHVD